MIVKNERKLVDSMGVFWWVVILIGLSIVFSIVWTKTAYGHRMFSIVLFLPLFALLGYLKGEVVVPFTIASIFLIFVFTASSGRSGIVTGILLGIESALACLVALSLFPFFSVDVYEKIVLWVIDGGFKILLILFWPLLLGMFVLGKIANDLYG